MRYLLFCAVLAAACNSTKSAPDEPTEGKAFKMWKIFDPNHPGDANYVTQDSNAALYLTMDADYEIQAVFKCGSSAGPVLPMILVMLGLLAVSRHTRSAPARH